MNAMNDPLDGFIAEVFCKVRKSIEIKYSERKVQIKMECNSLSYTPFDYRWLVDLLNFLEIYVGDVVVGVAALLGTVVLLAALLSTGLSLLLCIEDVLLCSTECAFNFFDSSIDSSDVAGFVGIFEFVDGSFDGGFAVGGNLVAEFGKLFLGLVDRKSVV